MPKLTGFPTRRLILSLAPVIAGLNGCVTEPHRAATAPDTAHAVHAPAPLDYLPALKGGYFRLDSQVVHRPYHIYVRLPEGFDSAAATRYPVVYLLDGDSLFPMLAPAHLFLHYDEKLPEAIVVGIAYGGFDRATNKRDVDYTAPGKDMRPDEGGAPQFLQVLRDELLPVIERRYPVDTAKRVLVGQSHGGQFVLWSAMKDPDLFWARIASNPSFPAARDRLFIDASEHRRSDLNLVLASGSRDTEARMKNAREWTSFWNARSDVPWSVRHLVIDGGTHAASIGEVYQKAMTWLFREEIARTVGKPADH